VPDSIARRDLIPQIRRDPNYFNKLNLRLLPTWGAKPIPPEQIDWSSPDVYKRKFRQEPGPGNALGVVRINMPNKHILYLHDTPLKQLFEQNTRAFSAGCVRVKRVLDLAAWLVKDVKGWTPLRIETTVALGQSENVRLKKHVPVHFVYVTAWASGNGIVQFRPDLYDRDETGVKVAEIDTSKIVGSRALAP
jgi:murein L,D-transpeptidase YcbB/YkuD